MKVKICYIEFLLLQDQLSVGYDYFSLHFRIVNFDLLNTKKNLETRARCKITVQANYEITNLLLSKKSWKVRFFLLDKQNFKVRCGSKIVTLKR